MDHAPISSRLNVTLSIIFRMTRHACISGARLGRRAVQFLPGPAGYRRCTNGRNDLAKGMMPIYQVWETLRAFKELIVEIDYIDGEQIGRSDDSVMRTTQY
jgi:hypothetical protein